jgi:biotin carboxylase
LSPHLRAPRRCRECAALRARLPRAAARGARALTAHAHAALAPQKLEAEGLAPDGVCTFNEMSVPIAARLAEALSLPGNPVAAVDAARDKFATRAIMQDAGLATPANALIEKEADLAAAAEKVGFPAVIKPIAGAGSMGVVRVDSAEELARIYAKVVADMSRAVVTSGALVYAPEDGATGASTKARGEHVSHCVRTPRCAHAAR